MALIGLAMGLVAFYVVIATETFESDKIAYVFETQQMQLDALSTEFSKELERSIQHAHLLLSGYDFESKKLNPAAQALFDSQSSLKAVNIVNQSTNETILHITKQENLSPIVRGPASLPKGSSYSASALDRTRFLAIARGNGTDADIVTKAIVEIPATDSHKNRGGTVAMIENGRLVGGGNEAALPGQLIEELSRDRVEKTMIRRINGEEHLISSVQIPGSNIKMASIESKARALGALNVLYERSMLFMAFSGFLTIIMALLISRGLTAKLHDLTRTAGAIGKGDFSQKPQVTSSNEIGLLQSAFARMIDEIQSLIIATKEKARMEEELKTAQLVQERMFPKDSVYEAGTIRIAGLYDTSTECGGDWWYYFRNGDDLFVVVADATGHGAPAALNTAASRSLFTILEQTPNLSLKELASSWDRAIASTSGQKVFMTALMVKINVFTGKGMILNASHEAPMLIDPVEGVDHLAVEKNGTLGEIVAQWDETLFELRPNQKLFLFTDGLWAVKNEMNKTLSEARFIKTLKTISQDEKGSKSFLSAVDEVVQDHRKDRDYPDDITLVCVDRLAA